MAPGAHLRSLRPGWFQLDGHPGNGDDLTRPSCYRHQPARGRIARDV